MKKILFFCVCSPSLLALPLYLRLLVTIMLSKMKRFCIIRSSEMVFFFFRIVVLVMNGTSAELATCD
jgi:hypothetical protein